MEKLYIQRLAHIVLCIVCLLWAAIFSLSCHHTKLSPALLNIDEVVRRTFSQGETHFYRVKLQSSRYFRAQISQKGIDTSITIIDPDGKNAVEAIGVENETLSVSTIAETPGDYQLVIRSLETEAITGTYEIRIEERLSIPADRNRVAAERAYAEAEQLRARYTAESSRKAISRYDDARSFWRSVNDKAGEARSLQSSAAIHLQLGAPIEALSRYDESLRLSKEIQDANLEGEILSERSYAHIQLGHFEKSLESCQRAIS